MTKIEDVVNESCFLVFQKLTLNFENVLFLSACRYFNLQDIKIPFEDVDFYAKLSLILDTPVGNSKTQMTIMFMLCPVFLKMGVLLYKMANTLQHSLVSLCCLCNYN